MTSKSRSRFQTAALAVVLTTALASAAVFSLPQNAAAVAAPVGTVDSGVRYGPPSFADLADRVEPAVVSIVVTGKTATASNQLQIPRFPEGSPFNEFFKQFGGSSPDGKSQREFKGVGSGFIISADGYIVTNNHVIERATEIAVVTENGDRYEATVQGRDPKTDLALLKVSSESPLPYVELGDSDSARVGEWVVAIGNPFGLGGTVTAGIISARSRDINSGPYDDFLQIDAPINRGNSGGPLFNNRGQVIGVNSAIYTPTGGSVGIGFAIPSNLVSDVVSELETSGKVTRGWLGVQIQPLTEEIADSLGLDDTKGALVAGIEPDSPAALGGVEPGDVIVGLDGEKIEEFKDLSKQVAGIEAGSASTLQVIRQGELVNLQVDIINTPGEDAKVALADTGADSDTPKIGVYLSEITAEARQRFRIGADAEGVLVANVEPGSPAAKAGIRAGQVISRIGRETVTSPEDVISGVRQAAANNKNSVLLMVQHDGQQRFVAVKFDNA